MISTRGRYAIRILIDLAENVGGGPVPLRDVAAKEGISKKYLEIIVRDLVAGGIVVGASGKGGGYKLVRKPEEISVGEVIELMEGPLAPVACLENGARPCPRASKCQTLPLWAEYDKMTHDYFYGKHLSDLVRRDPEEENPSS